MHPGLWLFLALRSHDTWNYQAFLAHAMPVSDAPTPPLVTGKHQGLDRQYERLDAQDHRVHDPDRIHHVEIDFLARAQVAANELEAYGRVYGGRVGQIRRDRIWSHAVRP